MSFQAHRQGFKCCFPCTAPKRYPGCHDHCPERAIEVANHEKALEIEVANHEKALEMARKDSDVNNYVINEIRRSQRRAGRA